MTDSVCFIGCFSVPTGLWIQCISTDLEHAQAACRLVISGLVHERLLGPGSRPPDKEGQRGSGKGKWRHQLHFPPSSIVSEVLPPQRLQQLFFPEGIVLDEKQFVRTAVTADAFKCLTAAEGSQNQVASPPFASWNQIGAWLNRL